MLPLLEIKNLKMYYETPKGMVRAVDDVSLSLDKGQTLGLVGESGCGKSSLALSVLKLLPENARIVDGQIIFDGEDIVPQSEKGMQKIRWRKISMVFQTAMGILNPVYRVGDQIIEPILIHEKVRKEDAKEKVNRLFEIVGLNPDRAYNYPHEYSGGMKQRAVIAMALTCNPDLVILDEPTTALDVIVQDQILRNIKDLQREFNIAILHISHDISVIAETCERIGVMYAGKLMEYGESVKIFKNPYHPYTQGLILSFPSIRGPKKELSSIPGKPPDLINPPLGCPFHSRCSLAKEICKEVAPAFAEIENTHYAACHFADKIF